MGCFSSPRLFPKDGMMKLSTSGMLLAIFSFQLCINLLVVLYVETILFDLSRRLSTLESAQLGRLIWPETATSQQPETTTQLAFWLRSTDSSKENPPNESVESPSS